MTNCARTPIVVAALAIVMGCAGSGEGLDQNGRPITSDNDDASAVLTADFNSIQDNVFTPVCSVCHSGASAPRGLRLDADSSYALLVGVASSQVPALQRIQPGNPDASYLLQKITGGAAIGQRMPLGGPYLPQATVDVIRQWITNGASRPAGIAKTSLHVVTTAPLNGATVTSLSQIVVAFNRELDANLINATTVILERVSASVDIVAANYSVPTANPATLLIAPHAELAAGTYRLTLRGSGGGALAGFDALPLNSSPPEASGASVGKDYTTTFTIQVQP